MSRRRARAALGAVAVVSALAAVLAACSSGSDAGSGKPAARSTVSAGAKQAAERAAAAEPVTGSPLRAGERVVRLAMPEAYTPSAPYGTGTDDYRCFVLDPHLSRDAFITGLNILPGTRKVVHHVILFRVPPAAVPAVEAKDRASKGEGWTCFGGTGVEGNDATAGGSLDDAPWLGAWAPGGSEQVMANGVGVPLAKGSRVIMQVHYNLLAGPRPDVTSAQLRLAPGTKKLAALETMLFPAPVELPCRPEHDSGPLCDRTRAVADTEKRFGEVGRAADFLHLLCGPVHAGPVQSCTRTMREGATIRAAAGHMHLLGRAIRIDVDPGTPRARTVLDIKRWDFDNQGAKPVNPVRLRPGDKVRVTCRHSQRLRDLLPAFQGQQEKYVVWGEGTTDEMCLGLLLVTRS
jgi:hypothetical protein